MILARRIEERFSKQEILYLYLNQIYFGHGAYGIGEAARTYFGKQARDLTISEGAQLAGLPKAPSRYSPHADPVQAEQRRRYVLERMFEDGFLDRDTYEAALADVPQLADPTPRERDFATAAYFTEEVRRELFERLGGDAVLEGGLTIETTLRLDLQTAALAAVRRGLHDLSKRQGYRGPLRRVEKGAIEAEIERVGGENGLSTQTAGAAPEPPADAAALAPGAAEAEVADLPAPDEAEAADLPEAGEEDLRRPARKPAGFAGDGPFTGVVTRVDGEAEEARVAFAPGIEAVVPLDDVSWAREPDPEHAPRRVDSIAEVFRVGDVARFVPAPGAGEGDLPRASLYQEPLVEGALLSIDIDTQEVMALVGGYDFARSQFDRVTQARRQPGSAFKPFIYGAALARGYTPASIVHDRPVVYTDEASGFVWRPRNYGRSFYGPITLREALARSVNNATVHLFRDVGVDFVIDYAQRIGIQSPLSRDLSLALGSSGVSLLELTRAYGVFPNQGRRLDPIFVRRVLDRDGHVLLENLTLADATASDAAPAVAPDAVSAPPPHAGPAAAEQLIPAEQAYLMVDLLRAVVVDPDGTGWRLRDLQRPVAGKTGTTNDQGDAWFMGFSPDVVTGVWVGHDESHFLGWGETGSRAAAPIWVDYMAAALAERPVRDFPVPDEIVFARIDRKTGLLADATSEDTVFQAFLAGTVPSETSRSALTESEGRRLLRMDAF
jgi:penicillin-binding protein 1A